MAGNEIVDTYRIEAKVDKAKREVDKFSRGFKKNFKDSEKSLKAYEQQSKKSFKASTEDLIKFALAAKGAQIILGSIANAVAENEKTNIKLTAALKNQRLEVGNNQRALNAMAASMELLTGISDETIRSQHAMALNFGVSIERVDEFTQASIRLANTSDMSLTSAMRNLIKSLSGMKGELGEAVPAIGRMTTAELKAGKAVELLNEQFKENLTLLNEGTTGAWNRLTIAVASLAEEMALVGSNSKFVNDTLRAQAGIVESLTLAISAPGGLLEVFIGLHEVSLSLVSLGIFGTGAGEGFNRIANVAIKQKEKLDACARIEIVRYAVRHIEA